MAQPSSLSRSDPMSPDAPDLFSRWINEFPPKRGLPQSLPEAYRHLSRRLTRPSPRATLETTSTRSLTTTTTRSKKRLVGLPEYEDENLRENFIFLLSPEEAPYPPEVAELVGSLNAHSKQPTLSPDDPEVKEELRRLRRCCAEENVTSFFKSTVFPDPRKGNALRCDGQLMNREQVPKNPSSNPLSELIVSVPKPDMLYGYNSEIGTPFTSEDLRPIGNSRVVSGNKSQLRFPFLVVEVKGDEPIRIATNQCLGGASTCVQITNRLNKKLLLDTPPGKDNPLQVPSVAFSIAANCDVAILYVTWFQDNKYLTKKVQKFCLDDERPGEFIDFCNHVHNIIDWGANARLKQLKETLAEFRAAKESQYKPPSTRRHDTATQPESIRAQLTLATTQTSSQTSVRSVSSDHGTKLASPRSASGKRPLTAAADMEVPAPEGPQDMSRSRSQH